MLDEARHVPACDNGMDLGCLSSKLLSPEADSKHKLLKKRERERGGGRCPKVELNPLNTLF